MTNLLSVLAALLVFAVIIIIHEAGHFFAAKAARIPVYEFSVGFGPKIFSVRRKEVIYSLRAVFLGGYVRFYGDDDKNDEYAFPNYSVPKRMLVMVAGVIANTLVALLVAVLILMHYGEDVVSPLIAKVDQGGPAYSAGLVDGDRITAVNSVECADGAQVIERISAAGVNPINISVIRDGQTLSFTVTPFYDSEAQRPRIGISMGYEKHRFTFAQAVPISVQYVKYVVVETFNALKGMIFGSTGTDELMGVVGTINIVSQSVRQGFEMMLRLAVLISINVALINILPLPALDGGKLVFLLIEAVRGKPIDPNKEGFVHMVGFAMFGILALVLTYKDIVRIITGG